MVNCALSLADRATCHVCLGREQPVISGLCLGSWTVKCGDRDAKYSPSGPFDRTSHLVSWNGDHSETFLMD